MTETTGYDVVVVGGGAGGLTAALVLARSRRRVAVIDAGEPRNAPAEHVRGFLSQDGTPPVELLAAGRSELAQYGVDMIGDRVDRVEPGFTLSLASGRQLTARRLVVATGLRDELPELPGVRERWGRDLLHCPYCHGYEVRDQPTAVLGTHPAAVHHALLLRQWTDDLSYLPHTQPVSEQDRLRLTARGIRVVEGEVDRLEIVDDQLRGVVLAGGELVERQVVFIFPRMVPRDDLLRSLGCDRDEQGWVTTDRTGRTSVPGVWAVGNVVDPRAQVVTAAGMGSAAGFALNNDLVQEEVELAVKDHLGRSEGGSGT
ncbi:NAD(P)/FAD-dependent oxidoreductase [Natronosporangium hydrolyticum]|uniref:NAD(P)/FAD-dependent oxidoreductase n=1 Tax=Natronosporangium hydrolyticum TaxID=2811111 RepID=A0A895YHH0_9ACTN|nr:NAD(P)/FAD-dependent oxidoreductase [Natronosporangium hydrolyticum]QSB13976.1 NAD(P)/FAD-dependent oxidoreductase [Natronosporangium hydrolyticum]